MSQHEMPEDLSKEDILLICRVPLDKVNRLYLGVMESIPTTPFFNGFYGFFFKKKRSLWASLKTWSARSKQAVEFSTNEQQKG